VLANRRSGNAFKVDISITANMMAWNDTLAVTGLAAFSRQNQERLWSLPTGRYGQVEAIALAGNAAVLAGRVKSGQWPNFLWVVSSVDGTKTEDIALDAPPTYDGLALAAGHIYVSLQNGKLICLGKSATSVP
jgi:hypothetical protein